MSRNERMKAKNELHKSRIKKGGYNKGKGFVPESEADSGLKRAVIIMPIIIVLAVIITLVIGLRQFRKLYDADMSGEERSRPAEVVDNSDSKKLLLAVSPENPLPLDVRPSLVTVSGVQVDKIMESDLKALLDAADKAGLSLELTGGYVSAEKQQEMFEAEVNRLMSGEGLSNTNAIEKAEKTVPAGNHSERQSGMLVTFSDGKSGDFSQTEEYRFLIRNAMKYGFVLRYPASDEKSTGFEYDPTAFRYVGKENALKMTTLNMCLEEYNAYLGARENEQE